MISEYTRPKRISVKSAWDGHLLKDGSLYQTDGSIMIRTEGVPRKVLDQILNRNFKDPKEYGFTIDDQRVEDEFKFYEGKTGKIVRGKLNYEQDGLRSVVLYSKNRIVMVNEKKFAWIEKIMQPDKISIIDIVSGVKFFKKGKLITVLMPLKRDYILTKKKIKEFLKKSNQLGDKND